MRDLFNWEDATKTLGFLLVNLVAVLHFYLPIRYFAMPVVVGMFFVLSEKSKAIERIACHAFAARKRYVHLRRLKKGDEPTSPLLRLPTARPVPQHKKSHFPSFGRGHNRQLVKSVVRCIFSRLDDDASGLWTAASSSASWRRPCRGPRLGPLLNWRRRGDGEADTANDWYKFDANGDGQIDRTEFESIVQKSGCVDVLTQDELSRRPTSHCSKDRRDALPDDGVSYRFLECASE